MHEERMARTSAPWIEMPPSLSPESAASARAAAFAVLRHGVRYLPVVDDGILVGLVAVGDLRRPHRTPGPLLRRRATARRP
jgi:CBS-domain-containing membrane protein